MECPEFLRQVTSIKAASLFLLNPLVTKLTIQRDRNRLVAAWGYGVGRVGSHCFMGLFGGDENLLSSPVMMQVNEETEAQKW